MALETLGKCVDVRGLLLASISCMFNKTIRWTAPLFHNSMEFFGEACRFVDLLVCGNVHLRSGQCGCKDGWTWKIYFSTRLGVFTNIELKAASCSGSEFMIVADCLSRLAVMSACCEKRCAPCRIQLNKSGVLRFDLTTSIAFRAMFPTCVFG